MPTKKIQKSEIITAALEILKTEDLASLTARRLAEMLDCSVQPIYINFASMDDLERTALTEIKALYYEYMNQGAQHPQPYKGMGLAYIRFARDYPNYFKLLFMSETGLSPETFIEQDNAGDSILKYGMAMSGLDLAEQKKLHLKVWIFTHGLATLVATGTIELGDAEVESLLTDSVLALVAAAQKNTQKNAQKNVQKNASKKPTGGGRYFDQSPTNH